MAKKSKDGAGAEQGAKDEKPAKRPRKGQQQIPGTERPERVDEIEEAASTYVEIRDKRMAPTKKEVEAQAKLLAAMKEHKLETYLCEDDEMEVRVVAKDEKAKVRRVGADGDADE